MENEACSPFGATKRGRKGRPLRPTDFALDCGPENHETPD